MLKTILFDKIALLRGLLTKEYAYVGPLHITIDTTRRCNLRCLGCRYQDPRVNFPSTGGQKGMDVSLDLLKQLCKDAKPMGTNAMILTGEGEPFLHPQYPDVISTIKESGYHLTARTNGTLMKDEIIHKMIDLKVDVLKVSLWATSIEEYQHLYPGVNTDNFNKIIEGLKRVAHIKQERRSELPSLIIHQVVNKYNFSTVEKMVDLIHQAGCDGLYFAPFKAWKGALTSVFLSTDEEKELERQMVIARKKMSTLGIQHNVPTALLRFKTGNEVWKKYPCYVAWFHARVKLDGTVIPCDPYTVAVGNLNQERMPQIWNNEHYRNFRRKTLSREGLVDICRESDCGFCCHLGYNARIHRVGKWLKLTSTWR